MPEAVVGSLTRLQSTVHENAYVSAYHHCYGSSPVGPPLAKLGIYG